MRERVTSNNVAAAAQLANLVAIHESSLAHVARGHEEVAAATRIFKDVGYGCESAAASVVESEKEVCRVARKAREIVCGERLVLSRDADRADMIAKLFRCELIERC